MSLNNIPWRVKILAKLILSRLPVNYSVWQRLGLFRLGQMDMPAYAVEIFRNHFERVEIPKRNGGFVALELGPGDSLFSAVIACAFGASKTYLVDVGFFAKNYIDSYQTLARSLSEEGLPAPDLAGLTSLEDVLAACSSEYKTSGLASLQTIHDESVDFIWSQATLEHIRKSEFVDTLHEMRRVIHPDGVCSHRVDLKDHLGGALNNLRFSERIWESNWMATSGFYTNRIRYSEMLELFKKAGFDVQVAKVDRWPELPLSKRKLASPFRTFPDEELTISGFNVLLRPN